MNFRTTLDFLLHDWLAVTQLTTRERFADHSRETFDAVFDTCERIERSLQQQTLPACCWRCWPRLPKAGSANGAWTPTA